MPTHLLLSNLLRFDLESALMRMIAIPYVMTTSRSKLTSKLSHTIRELGLSPHIIAQSLGFSTTKTSLEGRTQTRLTDPVETGHFSLHFKVGLSYSGVPKCEALGQLLPLGESPKFRPLFYERYRAANSGG